MARANQPTRPVAAGPTGLPRLLPPNPSTDLRGHLAEYGSIPPSSIHVVDHVRAAGLLGRGGAGFPTGTKMAAVAQRGRRPIIVANGTEGEPASAKDKVLMTHSPHLVLDGISIAAAALDATDAVLCIDRSDHGIVALMEHAISERNTAGVDRVPLRLEIAPDRYVAGEETALVHWLNGGEAKPTTTPPRPFEKGVRGRPTLVDNVETLANVALIARYGADWFRTIGPKSEPGSLLLTVSGHVTTPGVLEVASGSSFHEILSHVGGRIDETEAFLVGGYFGAWMPAQATQGLTISHASLKKVSGALGCGVVFALARGTCGITEAARVTRWMAGQSAGQCGPCANGLPAMADAFEALAQGGRHARSGRDRLVHLLPIIEGRGACRHPDGVVRFVRSALSTFAADVERHIKGSPCAPAVGQLPTPGTGGWR